MTPKSISLLTICGLDELTGHSTAGVSHVLSILDPDWPEPEGFRGWDKHHRTTLHFHDVIEPGANHILPNAEHVRAILAFGELLERSEQRSGDGHLLVHCHMGVSRSTAAMTMILAQANPEREAEEIFRFIEEIRPQAWPNSLMIGYADEMLGRRGELVGALGRLYSRRLVASPETEAFMRRYGRGREVEMALASGPPA